MLGWLSCSEVEPGQPVADDLKSIGLGRAALGESAPGPHSQDSRKQDSQGSHKQAAEIMGRRGKSFGAAAKKSRRHLEGMQASRSKAPPVARGECLTPPVGDCAEIKPERHRADAVPHRSTTTSHL